MQTLKFGKSLIRNSVNTIRKFSFTNYLQRITNIEENQKSIAITFDDKVTHQYHYHWLRDHCRCTACFNSAANERILNTVEITPDIKPSKVDLVNGDLQLKWPDNHESSFLSFWLKEHHYGQTYNAFFGDDIERIYWNASIKDNPPVAITFEDVLSNDTSLLTLCETIEKFGFGTVSSMPTNTDAMRLLGEKFGFLHENLYGDAVWILTNQAPEKSHVGLKDVAYTNVSLNSHHDGTFLINSQGLQSFHCHEHIGEGGETLLVDGIHAAYQLKEKNIDAFNVLSTTHIPSLYKDASFDMRNYEPMIKCDPISGQIYQVRLNENHRDVLTCLTFEEVESFYEALHEYLTLIRSPENEYWLKLTPGNCIILDNWRVLHGRASFTGKRTLAGFYVDKGDFLSQLRLLQQSRK